MISYFAIKSAKQYANLTNGGVYSVTLDQNEACVALKSFDYGIESLSREEVDILNSLIVKIKDQIWP